MNRREFIKKAFGCAVALAIPIPIEAAQKPTGNVWLKPEEVAEEALYYLGKGTQSLYHCSQSKEFPSVDFTIHREPLEEFAREISTPISFTLDEINEDNLKTIMEG